jgi:hypothetical protein
MAYVKKMLQESDREVLIEIIFDLEGRLKKKNAELTRARRKLNTAKSTIQRMKGTTEFLRKRVVELYPAA